MDGTTRSATLFGVFFGGFHVVKYGIHISLDPGEFTEVGLAGAISIGALMSKVEIKLRAVLRAQNEASGLWCFVLLCDVLLSVLTGSLLPFSHSRVA